MSSFYVIIIILVIAVVIYKFPGIFPESWKMRSGQEAMNYIFRLQPGELIAHQSSGIYDPNSHLDIKDTLVKNLGLGVVGKQLTAPQHISLALTNQNRFIFSHDPRHEPVSFDKNNLPKIIDTGRKSQKISTIPAIYRYPGTSGECRIIEIDSPDLPVYVIPENTGRFEVSTPVEFIPLLMDWVKKNQEEQS